MPAIKVSHNPGIQPRQLSTPSTPVIRQSKKKSSESESTSEPVSVGWIRPESTQPGTSRLREAVNQGLEAKKGPVDPETRPKAEAQPSVQVIQTGQTVGTQYNAGRDIKVAHHHHNYIYDEGEMSMSPTS